MSDAMVARRALWRILPDWPLVVWLVATALVLGFAGGLTSQGVIGVFNAGWGRALGEFALILLPSFALAAALGRRNIGAASGWAAAVSPFAGAGMVCPDTAYAALSPVAGRQKLAVAFGSYAGFKLLVPAGPLIVATGLGVDATSLLAYGLALLIPTWAIGVFWVRRQSVTGENTDHPQSEAGENDSPLAALAPFVGLATLLIAGGLVDFARWPVIDFLTSPKGALLLAATWAVLAVPKDQRRACIDSAIGRTGSLLLVIGAASAFGAVLTKVVAVADWVPAQGGIAGIVALFLLTAAFKLVQGSSMATFAAVAPVAAPLVAAANLPPTAAVFAICLGSFFAILPNDSYYWLVRKDALATEVETTTVAVLAGGAGLQAVTGLVCLLALIWLGWMG